MNDIRLGAAQRRGPTGWGIAWTFICAISLLPMQAMYAAEPHKAPDAHGATQEQLQAAQRRLDDAAREVAELSMSLSEDVLPHVMPFMGDPRQRAVLGINIGSGRDREQGEGVEIRSVSPGGAAAAAGLQAGDILVEVKGKSLRRDGDESPRSRLLEIMSEVEPGEKVKVNYRRADKSATASLVAQAPADRILHLEPPGNMAGRFEGPRIAFMRDDAFGAAEMVALTPKLGQYFGSDKGLLVVRAPADERLKLEEGDVIVDIDGRVPESAAHASRILASYETGEKLRLNVLRMKKAMTLDVEVPASPIGKNKKKRIQHSNFAPGPGMDALSPAPFMVPLPAPRPGAHIVEVSGRRDTL